MTRPHIPAKYASANVLDIPFSCREHAEQQAAFLNAGKSSRKYGVREHKGRWYVMHIC
jgi:hypothetical protein